jgi:hypothetical protein
MTRDEQIDKQLEKYSLTPEPKYAAEIREIIYQELNNQDREDNEILKLCCIQLFSIGNVEDSLLIWRAKESSFDASCYIDIQLTCGAGFEETKDFLSKQNTPNTEKIFNYLLMCEKAGDFDAFSVESQIREYRQYFYGEP